MKERTTTKKLISLALIFTLLFALTVPTFGAQNETASPYLLNTQLATVTISIDCWSCYFNYSVRPTCIMDAWDLNIESKLSSGNLSSIYCSICLSYTHDDGVFKHLNNHH